jgi:oligoendopeptidase F
MVMINNIKHLPKRDEIEQKYKWNMEDIYTTTNEWEEDFKKITAMKEDISKFKGTLAENAEQLYECLKFNESLMSLMDKVFVYARMKRDENNKDTFYQALADRAMGIAVSVQAASSFIVPEITRIEDSKLNDYIAGNNKLKIYRQFFNEIVRQKKHILTQEEEIILAMSQEMGNAPSNIFTMFNDADIKFPVIKDENNREVELTKGRFIKFLESRERRVRKDAFKALYDTYIKQKNTLGAILASNLKRDRFYASIRKYDSCLEASLDSDNVSEKVYDSLIDTVGNNLWMLHDYLKLRKKILNVDNLHLYDIYVPIVDMPEKEVSYEEALRIVKEGLKPLGSQYVNFLTQGLENRWIDVYETDGKTSGAYSWGAYTTHPYVLLNYQGTIKDIFTIAHEMGHALHSYYTNSTQPYIYSEYKIFVAEVASTVNELLLMNHMIENTKDTTEKAYLLNHYLEEFRGTVFRQVMFAEFEKIVHKKSEMGEAPNQELFSDIYFELNKKYFGSDVVIDDEIRMEWARIPHFYSSFYVYKYATGFSAAVSISQQIIKQGETAVKKYIEFLKSGSSDYPVELLKKAGVDLTVPKPIEDALDVFKRKLDDLKNLTIGASGI